MLDQAEDISKKILNNEKLKDKDIEQLLNLFREKLNLEESDGNS